MEEKKKREVKIVGPFLMDLQKGQPTTLTLKNGQIVKTSPVVDYYKSRYVCIVETDNTIYTSTPSWEVK